MRIFRKCQIGLFLLLLAHSISLADSFLADDSRNKDWNSPSASEAVFIGDATKQAPQIVIRKDALKPLISVVETDAKDVAVSSGDVQFNLGAHASPGGTLKIELNAVSAGSTVQVNDRDIYPVRGKWIKACLTDDKNISLTFDSATYVNIKFQQNSQDSPVQNLSLPRNDSIVPATNVHEMLERVRHSVFQIKIYDDDKELLATGTGFVVLDGGYALTNFHVIENAASAAAVLADSTDEVPITLVAVRPELDLALIRLKTNGLPPLSIENSDPGGGDDVWALGYPLDLGYTVNHGVVAGVRRFNQLPSDLQKDFSYDSSSVWVQTDCTINPGNSGGPLVDSKGAVVGINTWLYLKGNNTYFALRATQAQSLIKTDLGNVMSFAEAKEKFKTNNRAWDVVPGKIPHIDIPQIATASQLSSAAAAVENGIIKTCYECNGTGKIVERVQVGTEQNGPFIYPVMENRERECPNCHGRGRERNTPLASNNLVMNLVRLLAESKPGDSDFQEKLQLSYLALHDHVAADPVMLDLLTTKGRGILAQSKIQPKTPVSVQATYLLSIPGIGKASRIHIVVVQNSLQLVALTDPVLCDETDIHDVLIGGLVSGVTKTSDDRPIVFLENGFIIRIPTDKMIDFR